MKKIVSMFIFCVLSTNCIAGNVLNVQTPAVLSPEIHIPGSIKAQCKVAKLVGDQVFESVSNVYGRTKRVAGDANLADELLLKSTITLVWGASYGGGWTGPRHISVTLELIKGGEVLQTTTSKRTSNGGVWGAFKSTCGIMDRLAKEVGEDAADWIKDNLSEVTVASVPDHRQAAETSAAQVVVAPAQRSTDGVVVATQAAVAPKLTPAAGTKPEGATASSSPAPAIAVATRPADMTATSPQDSAANAAIAPLAQSIANQLGCGTVQANGAATFIAPCSTYDVLIDCGSGQCRPMHTVNVKHDE
jgi:hypothetical protein